MSKHFSGQIHFSFPFLVTKHHKKYCAVLYFILRGSLGSGWDLHLGLGVGGFWTVIYTGSRLDLGGNLPLDLLGLSQLHFFGRDIKVRVSDFLDTFAGMDLQLSKCPL